jgi:tRNA threonylcarbamoyl adenosine modification protein (Sua5/YciO/YrdC/YwlC family)
MVSVLNRVLHVDPRAPDPRAARQAADCLARGGLVILPTDTVYGVAADPRVPGAEEALYRAKQRPADKAVARLAWSTDQVTGCGAQLNAAARRLAARYWPGPLTLVLPAPGGECGFRVPDHAVCLAVLQAAGTPLAVSSANRSGAAPAVTAEDAVRQLGEAAALTLDAGRVPGGEPSTVLRVAGEHVEILREGAISGPELLNWARG